MSKHTPGPWLVTHKLSGSENHRGYRIANASDSWALADVQPGDSDGVLGLANARLIAAAPELLAIAQRLKAAGGVWPDLAPALDAAIAKATGAEA